MFNFIAGFLLDRLLVFLRLHYAMRTGEMKMNDITMCSSDSCPIRDKCYRIQKKPNEYQSWCNFGYSCNENSGFEDFIKNDPFSNKVHDYFFSRI